MAGFVTGNVQHLIFSTGGANPADTVPSIYRIVNRGNMVESSEVQDLRSLGNHKPQQQREGLLRVYGNGTFFAQRIDLLSLCERDGNGALQYFNVQGGDDSDALIHKSCKVDSVTIELAKGAPVRTSIAWKGLYARGNADPAYQATLDQAGSTPGDQVWMWYNADWSGIASLEITAITININHNVDWVPLISTGATPFERMGTYLSEGDQVVTCDLKLLEREAYSLMANTIAEVGSCTVAVTNTTTTGTFTLTGLKRGDHERPLSPGELIEHGARFNVSDWSIA